ncbi:MAG: hypothetical protein NT077_04815 [Candidatus Taylorbacteria bacterium]|nr:hypothetical protein [Candidatus Taylorbacteria bacterium]
MNKTHRIYVVIVSIIVVLLIVTVGISIYIHTQEPEMMSINLYVQNKEIARTSDCGVTQKVTYQIPKTVAVADASLKVLFVGELSRYGVYKSVNVSNGIARVMLDSNMMPTGYPISALSSCENGHLMSVLNDTLTQYKNIQAVELYSPEGKIEF